MTNLDALYKAINENNQRALFKWLASYAKWFDPGGWWSRRETMRYLEDEEDTFDLSDVEDDV